MSHDVLHTLVENMPQRLNVIATKFVPPGSDRVRTAGKHFREVTIYILVDSVETNCLRALSPTNLIHSKIKTIR